MRKIEGLIYDQLMSLPRLALKPILERKLEEQKVALPEGALEALVDHILSDSGESFVWDDGNEELPKDNHELVLSFGETDVNAIEKFIERVHEALPDVIHEAVTKSGVLLSSKLRKRWEFDEPIQRYEYDEFRSRLEERWGEGLSLLRLLLEVVREIGADIQRRHRKSRSKRYVLRRFVLGRLHLRSCQVADEIVTLMENGFADGAMARWRTLHEIDVIATIIADGDEELARRYIDHDAVEVKKQADDYEEKQVPLGYAPLAKRERKRIEDSYNEAIRKYGQSFRYEYGWASDHLKDKKPDFKKLQDIAKQSSMNSYYKLANFNVHAGVHAIFFSLSNMASGVPLSGRSNAGLMEPGQNTAYTLVRITGALIGIPKNIDKAVELSCLISIRDAVPKAFGRAGRKLKRDEAKWRRELKQSKS